MNPGATPQTAVRFVVCTGLNLMLGVALLFAAVLRETHMFWLNAGGFPVALRTLVKLLFFPGLLALGAGATYATALTLCRPAAPPYRVLAGVAVLVQWALLAAIVALVAWNNVVNWLSGAPLHRHSP